MFPIVGIGASAGGLEAVTQLLQALPADSGMAFVIIQHLDPHHKSMLTELLSKATPMNVRQAEDGMGVEPNCGYVIPPNTYLTLTDGNLALSPRSETGGPHLPIDIFFRSLAETQGDQAVGVILSGAGSDGALGMEAIHSQGGMSLVQDPRSAKYDGMPRSAIATGCADLIMTPDRIANELVRISRHPYVRTPASGDGQAEPMLSKADDLSEIFAVLRKEKGVDFNHYKRSTIQRRIARRMFLQKIEKPQDYLSYLQSNKDEVESLHNDLLIQVTRFFRDPETFEILKGKIFPEILKTKSPEDPFRLWVAGCSSGEEVYSLAISLLEFLGDKSSHVPIQMFGTDVSDTALEKARAGVYLENIEIDVSADRLRRFFNKAGGRYQINKSVRDLCVFAKQNILKDPPFSKLDLISCRNVLIYLEPALQKKILSIFHFSLITPGWLMVGSSENPGLSSNLFSAQDKKQKVYSKMPSSSKQIFDYSLSPHQREKDNNPLFPKSGAPNVQKEADRILLGRYAPVGVLVNEQLEVLEFRGDTHLYLHNTPGEASLKLLRMAREGIVSELAEAFRRGKERPYRKSGLRVEQAGRFREVTLEVIPLKVPFSRERFWVVTFESTAPTASMPKGSARTRAKGRKLKESPADSRSQKLASLESHLQFVIEEKAAAVEEMQSANEEVLSSNEELQSINEELQTAKEELQATNEELTTVNEQLRRSNLETVSQMNDLNNFVDSTRVPIITVGNDLRIRRFTPQAEKMLNLIPTDVGRLISDITSRIHVSDLDKRILKAIDTVAVQEEHVQDKEGRWNSLRIHPYITIDKKIDGAVVVLMDVDVLKRNEIHIAEAMGKIQQLNTELDKRVETRTKELAIANKELEAFTGSVSHDLRAPLRGINLYAQVLSDKYSDQLGEEGKAAFQKIRSATQQMAQMVDDLLSLSRLDRNKMRLDTVDLTQCAKMIAEELTKSAPERRVQWDLAPGLKATGDENLLRIALMNLLSNAWKFTSKHPTARIAFGTEEKEGEKVYFVRDDGAGFNMAEIDELFGVFKRLHPFTEFPGTGIGLTTVQRIIHRHGGRIWAEAKIEQGATFYFTLTPPR